MDATTILVAAIAATPPTLAIIAGHLRTGQKLDRTEEKVNDAASKMDETNRKVDRIDHAVNNQPANEPPLVKHVQAVARNVLQIKSDVRVANEKIDGLDTRVANLERKVG